MNNIKERNLLSLLPLVRLTLRLTLLIYNVIDYDFDHDTSLFRIEFSILKHYYLITHKDLKIFEHKCKAKHIVKYIYDTNC